jgi:hypothetical protein
VDPTAEIEVSEHGLVVTDRLPSGDVSEVSGSRRRERIWKGEVATTLESVSLEEAHRVHLPE